MNISQLFGMTPPTVFPYTSTLPCVNPELVIGMELETENCGGMTSTAYQKLCAKTNFKIEQDGSLRGVAYEFISYPMKSTNALAALDDFFATTKFGKDNYTDRCSVHVHVNCTDMELEQVSNVALLYTIMEDILFEFVGGDRDTNIYCIPWNQCRQHFNLISKFLGDGGYTLRNWNKYTALNLIPLRTQGTVEFRQMHGTSDMGKLTTWINLIGAIFNYAKSIELNNLIAQIKELNTSSQYEQFFNNVLGRQLPYNDVYSQKLEEGVIFAKYSLMHYKGKADQKKKVTFDEWAATNAPNGLIPAFNNAQARNARVPPIHPITQARMDEITTRAREDIMLRMGGLRTVMQAGTTAHPAFTWNTVPTPVMDEPNFDEEII